MTMSVCIGASDDLTKIIRIANNYPGTNVPRARATPPATETGKSGDVDGAAPFSTSSARARRASCGDPSCCRSDRSRASFDQA